MGLTAPPDLRRPDFVAVALPPLMRPARHPGYASARIVRDVDAAMLAVPFAAASAAKFLVAAVDVGAIIRRRLVGALVHPFPEFAHDPIPVFSGNVCVRGSSR